jgi:PAS domain S-box-containing protein
MTQSSDEASKARLRFLELTVDSADNGMVVTDRDGVVLWANQAFSRQTGYPRDDIVGQTLRILRSGRQDRAFYTSMWQTLAAGRVWRGELINRRKDGTLFAVEMTATPVRGADGGLTNFVAVTTDVSEARRLRDQAAQAARMECVGRLAGGVAHDFNNLLQSILGYAELLRTGMKDGDPALADVEQIQTSARQAADLTRQLLAFSRRQLIRTEPLDLNTVVERVVPLIERVVGEHIRLHLDLAADLDRVQADAAQIESVIMSLAANSRDAMPGGGRLTIATRAVVFQPQDLAFYADACPGRFVCLSFTDTGTGMAPDVLQHIFEPFYTTKGVGKGAGLGLSTVHGTVYQHGGWVHVYSEKGQGTCFKLYLPTVNAPGSATPEAVEDPRPSAGKHILVVEDEDAICQLAARVLQDHGYRVTMARSAAEASIAFRACRGEVDLLFCDVVLPDRNGVALVESLLQVKPGISVLMVSGYPDDFARWETIRERGYPFLQKPYPARELLRAVRQQLDPEPTPKGAP